MTDTTAPEGQHVLVYCRLDKDYSLWVCTEVRDFVLVSWAGEVAVTASGYPHKGFDPARFKQVDLTQAQGQAAIMVARSAASREVWWRYAERIMGGELS